MIDTNQSMIKMISEILTILFYGIGDLWTTKIDLNMEMKEHNPLVRVIIKKTGFVGFIVIKSAIIYIFILYLSTVIWIMALCGIFITVFNIIHIIKYKKDKSIYDCGKNVSQR